MTGTTTIDLQSFCAKDDVRSYLLQPFVIGGHTYATNGHIAVRVPGGEPDPEQRLPEHVREAVLKMFATEYTDFEPLPQIPAPTTCPDCNGAGTVEEAECDDCNGAGEFAHGSHEYECKECDGTGTVRDVECNNRDCRGGELFQPMRVGAAFFDVRYLHRIAQLPSARIRVVGPEAFAAFVFDGGEGRVMPCRER